MERIAIPRWLRSPHLQTIGAAVPRFTSLSKTHKTDDLRIPMPESPGHFLPARGWWVDTKEPRPVVVVYHGIGGSADSHCCVRAGIALHQAGYHVVRLDMRGA